MDKKICPDCKVNQREKRYDRPAGQFKRTCKQCRHKPYRKFKGKTCEFCGFVPVHWCQLDVDHKDGDNTNNDPSNLQTLCANCHRLKTIMNKENNPIMWRL